MRARVIVLVAVFSWMALSAWSVPQAASSTESDRERRFRIDVNGSHGASIRHAVLHGLP